MSGVAASVARAKLAHPEVYCSVARCLWYIGDEPSRLCPRHRGTRLSDPDEQDYEQTERERWAREDRP